MSDKEMEEIRRKKMEELLRKQNDPKRKAKEFAKAIVECDEYKNFIKFNEELQKNQTAQNLLREFQQKQAELQWNGFDPKTLEELRDLQMKINKNDIIQNFVNAQNELVDILRKTNNIISGKIGTQFAFFQGGGCCG
ncbi:MAG: YlbF family regulator [Candidatus Altiarchaeota archaeon]